MCTRVDTCINKHFSFKIFLLTPPPFEKFLDPRLNRHWFKLQVYGSPIIKSWDGDRRDAVPSIVKNVYLLRRKSCARFGLDFSLYLLCQVKNPHETNTRHVYLFKKNIVKPQIAFIGSCRPENLYLEFISYNHCHFGCIGNSVHYQFGIWFSIRIGKNEHRTDIFFFSVYILAKVK